MYNEKKSEFFDRLLLCSRANATCWLQGRIGFVPFSTQGVVQKNFLKKIYLMNYYCIFVALNYPRKQF